MNALATLAGFFISIFLTGVSAAGLATALRRANEAGAALWAIVLVAALIGFAALWRRRHRPH